MSVNILETFNSANDNQVLENEFSCIDRNFVYINDIMNNNYASGYLNFNSQNVIGHDSKRVLSMNNGFLVIPFGCVLSCYSSIVNACLSFGTNAVNNANFILNSNFTSGVALKMQHHIFNSINNKFGNQVINQPTEFVNIYRNEKLKRLDENKYQLFGDLSNIDFDDSKSYGYATGCGEYNNSTYLPSLNAPGSNPSSYVNSSFIRKSARNNFDQTTYNSLNTLDNVNFMTNGLKEGFVGVITRDFKGTNALSFDGTLATTYQSPIVGLVFQYVAIVPLSLISEFYEVLPSIVSLNNFELKLQTNLASQNYWSATIGAATNNIYSYTSVSSNQSVGQCCPFMVPNVSSDGRTGLQVIQTGVNAGAYTAPAAISSNGGNGQISVTPFIGYVMGGGISDSNIKGTIQYPRIQGSTSIPARLYIPSLALTDNYLNSLIDNKTKTLLFNDYLYDFATTNVAPSQTISRQLIFQTGRIRNLYIIPYISSSVVNNQPIPTYQSLISSSPTTCSYSKVSELMVFLGSVNVFFEPISYDFLQYNACLINQNDLNGNSLVSEQFKGRIKFSDWKKCYGVICVDLTKAQDQVNDDMTKSLQIKLKNDNNVPMDYLIIIEYQSQFEIDRLTGQIIGSSKL